MQEILDLTRKKMRESGEYDRPAFHEYLEESIQYFLEKGRLSDDVDLDLIKEQILERYNEIEEREGE